MQPFGHNRNGPKIGEGALPPFGDGRAGSPSNTKSPGLRPSSIPSGILIYLAATDMGRKLDGGCTRLGQGAGSPSNNVVRAEDYLPAKFHLDPSDRLATVHERHRQDRTDRQRTDSIGRIVLQTVAQKSALISTEKQIIHVY